MTYEKAAAAVQMPAFAALQPMRVGLVVSSDANEKHSLPFPLSYLHQQAALSRNGGFSLNGELLTSRLRFRGVCPGPWIPMDRRCAFKVLLR